MKTLWHIKLIGCLAIMAAPVISAFICPCNYSHESSIKAGPKCCSCETVPDQLSCCANSSVNAFCIYSHASQEPCHSNPCKCPIDSTYGNLTALVPGNHRIVLETLFSNNFECAYIIEAYVCATLQPHVAHIQQLKIPLHITKCAMLC